MDILVIGNNTIDQVLTMRGRLVHGQKSIADGLQLYAGGQAANVACTLAGLNLSVHYLGAFGDDPGGVLSKVSLMDCQISLEGESTIPNCVNHTAVVIVDCESGRRTIIMRKDDRLRLTRQSVRPEWVNRATLVYVDNQEPEAALEAALLASRRSIPVLADLERLVPLTTKIVSYLSSLIAPARILCDLTSCEDLRSALLEAQRMGPSTVIATRGSAGAMGVSADGIPESVPAFSCSVKDTTGAGDAFHAGYAAAIFAGLDFRRAMQFASRVAAAKCEFSGPRVSRERLAELGQKFLGTGTKNTPERHRFI
jgi:sugar/nucleoside kinase (ribokinase family)